MESDFIMKYSIKLCKDLVAGDIILWEKTFWTIQKDFEFTNSAGSVDFGGYGILHVEAYPKQRPSIYSLIWKDQKMKDNWGYENMPVILVEQPEVSVSIEEWNE